ncbi:MAG: hypothetical protein ACRERE_09795 [Candidatus Entotheonellia bacterium]
MTTITLEVLDRGKAIPLIEAALQKEVAHLEIGILKTRRRIEAFEQKYDCKLGEIDHKAPSIDPLERVEWEGESEMLKRLEAERELLRTIRVCG